MSTEIRQALFEMSQYDDLTYIDDANYDKYIVGLTHNNKVCYDADSIFLNLLRQMEQAEPELSTEDHEILAQDYFELNILLKFGDTVEFVFNLKDYLYEKE